MNSMRKGLLYGAILGFVLALMIVLWSAISLMRGSDTEMWEAAGMTALLLGFPMSFVADWAVGGVDLLVLPLVVIANWSLVGGLLGGLVSVARRLQEKKA